MEVRHKLHFVCVSSLLLKNRRSPLYQDCLLSQWLCGSDDMDKYFKTSCTQHESTCAPHTHSVYGPEVAVNQDLLLSRGLKSCRLSPSIKSCSGSRLSVNGGPATKSRFFSRGPSWLLFGLSSDWTQLRLVTTEGWCRVDVWSNLWQHKCIKHKPRTRCLFHGHHLKGHSQPEAFDCMTEIQYVLIPLGLCQTSTLRIWKTQLGTMDGSCVLSPQRSFVLKYLQSLYIWNMELEWQTVFLLREP